MEQPRILEEGIFNCACPGTKSELLFVYELMCLIMETTQGCREKYSIGTNFYEALKPEQMYQQLKERFGKN